MNRTFLIVCLAWLCLWPATGVGQSSRTFWQRLKPGALDSAQRDVPAQDYETFFLDLPALEVRLGQAPAEFNGPGATLTLALPSPGGTFQRYAITQSQVLHPDLAARYPMIRTYVGRGIDDPTATVRLDVTEFGFHAQVLATEGGSFYIDPYHRQTTSEYLLYRASDPGIDPKAMGAQCGGHGEEMDELREAIDRSGQATRNGSGADLYTLRIAIAADELYAQFHGGTLSSVTSAITTLLNRANGIFEPELAIRMELIPQNDQLIFLSDATDPYTDNGSPGSMLVENQRVVDQRVGNGSYDVGHVLTRSQVTGGVFTAGIASRSSVCLDGSKARGVSGLPTPVASSLLRIFAHELGHQYSAPHIYNTNDPNCASQRVGLSAYEPGGGSTIMGYTVCVFDLNASDLYFNVANYEQMFTHTRQGPGMGCAVPIATGNDPPTVEVDSVTYIIPIETPFELTAVGSDPNGDALTYCWEQHDLGPGGNPNTPEGNAPIFRSFPPTSSPTRVFPRLSDVLRNTTLFGETYPTYSRELSFRATVRDNNPNGGGVAYQEMEMMVTEQAGPFRLTYPNLTEVLDVFFPLEITWDPANTQRAPIRCEAVDILLSMDGGQTFPYVLAQETPNDGRTTVVLPDTTSGRVRIKIQASDNVFFDVSNQNLALSASSQPGLALFFESSPIRICAGLSSTYSLQTASRGGAGGTLDLNAVGLPDGLTVALLNPNASVGEALELEITAAEDLSPGDYTFRLVVSSSEGVGELKTVNLTVADPSDPGLRLLADPTGNQNYSTLPTLGWQPSVAASDFGLQVATSPSFVADSMVIDVRGWPDTVYQVEQPLEPREVYYWRAGTDAGCGTLQYAEPAAFQVGDCQSYFPPGLPLNIPDNRTAVVSSRLEVPAAIDLIADLNLLNLSGQHDGFSDLRFTLNKTGGPAALLFEQSCGRLPRTFRIGLDDESPVAEVPCPVDQGLAFQGVDPLSAFDGLRIEGEYELSVQDLASGEGGRIDSWELEVCKVLPSAPFLVRNNPLSVPRNQEANLTRQELRVLSSRTPPEAIFFRVVGTPRFGSLILDGNELPVGGFFTQADLDSSRLVYQQAGAVVSADSFRFTVEVAGAGWLGLETFNIDVLTSEQSITASAGPLRIFPNPSQGEVTVRLPGGPGPAHLQVYNLTGQRVLTRHWELSKGVSEQVVSLAGQPSGLYLFEVQTKAGRLTAKARIE